MRLSFFCPPSSHAAQGGAADGPTLCVLQLRHCQHAAPCSRLVDGLSTRREASQDPACVSSCPPLRPVSPADSRFFLALQTVSSVLLRTDSMSSARSLIADTLPLLSSDANTDEEMIDLFAEDTDGTALKHKSVMGRRNWTQVDFLPASGELRYDIRVEIVQGGGDTKGFVRLTPSSPSLPSFSAQQADALRSSQLRHLEPSSPLVVDAMRACLALCPPSFLASYLHCLSSALCLSLLLLASCSLYPDRYLLLLFPLWRHKSTMVGAGKSGRPSELFRSSPLPTTLSWQLILTFALFPPPSSRVWACARSRRCPRPR